MSNPEIFEANDQERQAPAAAEQAPRAAGSPLPLGSNGHTQASTTQTSTQQAFASQGDSRRFTPVPPPGRALPGSQAADRATGFQRAVGAMRLALPFMQRLLPLLDGNVGTTVSNMLTPHPQTSAATATTSASLAPLEDGLAELQTQHRELCGQLVEQNTSLKRVEDQLEMVREATDRNTLEQQELQ
ncbi:MAG: hypothetical protein ACRD27_06925 [Terracidiphilus sp.]